MLNRCKNLMRCILRRIGLRRTRQQHRVVITNMVYQGPFGRWSVPPQQRSQDFAMVAYFLNLRIAIQTLPFEEGIVVLPVTIEEIGDVQILGFLD